jgi:hypothetical protein
MARGGLRAATGVLTSLASLWAVAQAVMGCDLIAGIHTINPNDPPAGGTGGGSGAGGSRDSGACSPEALSCAACASCGEVVEVVLSDFGAPTSPEGPLTGKTAGTSRAAAVTSVECKQAEGPERVYAVHAGKDGFLTAKLSRAGTEFDSVLYARKSCCSMFDPTTHCSDSRKSEGDHSYRGGEVISFRVAQGEVWYLFIDGADSAAAGGYTLDLNLTSGVGCMGQGSVPITIEAGSAMKLSGGTSGLGNDGLNRCFLNHIDGVGTFSEVIYELRAPADVAAFDLSLNGTFDTVLYARSTCVDANFGDQSEISCVDENSGKGGEFIQGLQNTGSPLYVFVDTGPLVASSYDYTLIITPK